MLATSRRARKSRRRGPWPGMLLAITVFLPSVSAAAPCPELDHQHAAWTRILERWVDDGNVDYRGMADDGEEALNAYLASLSAVCSEDYVRWSREQRLAFWVNAYNAYTVRLILDHYPIASIRKIGWLPGAAFRKDFIPMPGLKGGKISLNEIEHDTLRADFKEPRIHFALVCASRSCPVLRSEAYRPKDLDSQFDDQAKAFLRDPGKNRFDQAKRTAYLSAIFDWFAVDFEAASGSVPAFVAPYVDQPWITAEDVKVEHLDYDWSLNERP